MGIRIIRKGSSYRRWWYGEYRENGKLKRVKLTIKVAGTPPDSFSARDEGDTKFEISKVKAQKAFDDFMSDRQQKGNAENLLENLIESKTGEKVVYIRLSELADKWNSMPRTRELTEGRQKNNTFSINDFATFCKKEYLYQVSSDDVKRYFAAIRQKLAWSSVKSRMSLLSGAFNRFLPHGCHNPFKTILKRDTTEDAATIHHVPLTNAQIERLKELARGDEILYPLVIAGLYTGARLKDLALMRKDCIDLRDGFVTFIAAKTTTRCELPLFDEFRNLCEGIINSGDPSEPLLFPEAARMYLYNRSGLVHRGKLLFAKALFGDALVKEEPTLVENGEPIPPKTPEDVYALIDQQHYLPSKAAKMKEVYRRYVVEKQTYRTIETETRFSRGSIHGWMQEIEALTHERVVRFEKGTSQTRNLLAKTRIYRSSTKRGVSGYGWASLRATFCRIAITEQGIDAKQIMRAVGHKQFKTTMTFYNNPTREHQKQLWLKNARSRPGVKPSMTTADAKKVLSSLSPAQLEALKLLGVSSVA